MLSIRYLEPDTDDLVHAAYQPSDWEPACAMTGCDYFVTLIEAMMPPASGSWLSTRVKEPVNCITCLASRDSWTRP